MKEAVRQIVYEEASGEVRIELIKPIKQRADERPAPSGGKIQVGDLV